MSHQCVKKVAFQSQNGSRGEHVRPGTMQAHSSCSVPYLGLQATIAPEPHATAAGAAAEWDYEAKVGWVSQATNMAC